MSEEKTIVHLDLDTFFVSVERLLNPALTGKPVIIGHDSDRGVVASCSYETRKFGVHSAMPVKMAKKLCPDAIIVSSGMANYSHFSQLVTQIIAEEAPVYQKASIDEHFLDISGMDKFFGCIKWSKELREKIIKETGLPISFGISINKTIAKIATGEAKPNGLLHIPKEKIHDFLDPLPIKKIPMVGKKSVESLNKLGIHFIKDLRLTPPDVLENKLGKYGLVMWKKANGLDFSPVKQYSERKSISAERTFEKDHSDKTFLKQKLISLVEKIAFQLRKKEKLASVITIKIRYPNFETHTFQKQIPYTCFDHQLIKDAISLFEQVYTQNKPLRLIGCKLSGLINGSYQLDMFEDTSDMIKLYQSIDQVKARFGEKLIQRAVGVKTQGENQN